MLLLKAYLIIEKYAYQKQLANFSIRRCRSMLARHGRKLTSNFPLTNTKNNDYDSWKY